MQSRGFPWYIGITESDLLGELLVAKKKTYCWIPGRDFTVNRGEVLMAMGGIKQNGSVAIVRAYHAEHGMVDCLAIDFRPVTEQALGGP